MQSQSTPQSSTDRNTQTSDSHQDIASSAQTIDSFSVNSEAVSSLGASAVQHQLSSADDTHSGYSDSASQQQHASADNAHSCLRDNALQQRQPHSSADNADLHLSGRSQQQQHASAEPCLSSSASQQRHSPADNAQPQLPILPVSDVSSDVFQLVLEFAYSGGVQVLAPQWLKASGAELLFEAAERYLLPLLKVSLY